MLDDNHLIATHLFTAQPHIFVSKTNPLAKKEIVHLSDLEDFPYLSYDQGTHNSFYFSEEISLKSIIKSIVVSDRATLFNLLIGLDGYTIATGILPNSNLNGE